MGSTLTVIDCHIENNQSQNGAGIYSVSGTVAIDSSVIAANKAANAGGGIYVADTNLTVVDSIVGENVSAGQAGGIYFLDSNPRTANSLDIKRSTISGNKSASQGHGMSVRMNNGTFNLSDNMITENIVLVPGNVEIGRGGGVYANLSNVVATISNNSIVKNSALSGGGMWAMVSGGGSF